LAYDRFDAASHPAGRWWEPAGLPPYAAVTAALTLLLAAPQVLAGPGAAIDSDLRQSVH